MPYEEIHEVLDEIPDGKEINFDEFKQLVAPSVLTQVTQATMTFGSAFGAMLGGDASDEKLQEVFKKIDADESGLLDKNELERALFRMG